MSFSCFTEDLSLEDLIIDVDNTLAKQLYKRWEKSIQVQFLVILKLNCLLTRVKSGNKSNLGSHFSYFVSEKKGDSS